jgi:hypothetical protein
MFDMANTRLGEQLIAALSRNGGDGKIHFDGRPIPMEIRAAVITSFQTQLALLIGPAVVNGKEYEGLRESFATMILFLAPDLVMNDQAEKDFQSTRANFFADLRDFAARPK